MFFGTGGARLELNLSAVPFDSICETNATTLTITIMNPVYETIPSESSPLPALRLENLAGDTYLKIDFAEFGYVEYKRDDLADDLNVLGVFEVENPIILTCCAQAAA